MNQEMPGQLTSSFLLIEKRENVGIEKKRFSLLLTKKKEQENNCSSKEYKRKDEQIIVFPFPFFVKRLTVPHNSFSFNYCLLLPF